MPLPTEKRSLQHELLNKNRTAFSKVIERYISLAHGLPPAPDDCPYLSPRPGKNKTSATLSYLQKNRSRTGATIKNSIASPANSLRQDSYSDGDDFVKEVEESLQRRKKQLRLSDDFTLEEIDDDEADPTWNGSHHHVRKNLSSRLNKKRGQKRKLTDDRITNAMGSSDENKPVNKRSKKNLNNNESELPVDQVSPAQNKAAELRRLSLQYRLSDVSSSPKRVRSPTRKVKASDESSTSKKRSRQTKAKVAPKNKENPNQNTTRKDNGTSDQSKKNKCISRTPKRKQTENQNLAQNTTHIISPDQSNVPKKRGRSSIKRGRESQEVLRRPNKSGACKNIQSVSKNETRTVCSNGHTQKEEQRPEECRDNIVKLVQKAVGWNAGILQMCHKGKNIVCLLDTLDPVYIMLDQNSPSKISSGKEIEIAAKQTSRKKKKKGAEKQQSTRTHATNDVKINSQVKHTVKKTPNKKETKAIEKQQTVGKSKAKPSEASTKRVVKKRGRSNTRTEFSPPPKVVQQSKSNVEHSTLKEKGQRNSKRSERISKPVTSPEKRRNDSAVPNKPLVAAPLTTDAILLSPGHKNSDMVPSSEGSVLKRVHSNPGEGTEKTTTQPMQPKPSDTNKSPSNRSESASKSETSNRSLSKSTSGLSDKSTKENSERKRRHCSNESGLELSDEEEWLSTSDEDDTISEFSTTKKKKSFLRRPQEYLKIRKHKLKCRESIGKIVFDDDDDDILIMEPPKSMLENRRDDLNPENSLSTRGVKDKPITASPLVSLQTQRPSKRAADGHQGSLTRSFYTQGLINNSVMKAQETVATASAKALEGGKKKGEPNPEDMWHLEIPSLHQQSSNPRAMRTTKTKLQQSGVEENTVAAPQKPTTVTNTNISDSGITSKASKSMRSFWTMESDEEAEDRENENTESLFRSMSSYASASRLAQESTVLPNYSTLGPERWISVARAMQKRKKNAILRLPFQ